MGLKQDLIDAKNEGLKLSGASDKAIQQAENVLDTQSQMEVDAIVNFLTKCQFRITELAANVVLDDFKIGPQNGDVLNTVQVTTAGGPGNVSNGDLGVRTKDINVGLGTADNSLESTGYAFIGSNPNSQDNFVNITTPDGSDLPQTSVELFRDDIEDLL